MEINKENIRVFVRCRPPASTKRKVRRQSILRIGKDNGEITIQARVGEKSFDKNFMYEEIFNEKTKQEEVYKTVVQPLISDVLMGYHCTVFAYGQTGTGKTYTIEGERSNKSIPWEEDHLAGIIPRTLFDLFKELSRFENEFSIHISAVQIYNEEIIDLLSENESMKLKMFEDNIVKGSILIQGLTEISVCTLEESYNVIETAMSKRQTTATLAHGSSSRSHAVFTISVITKTNNKVEIYKMGKLTIVDLAGNENIGRSGAVDRQAREAGSINQSLLTLNRVTMALVRKAFHIPYRESKLTRILQDSLGGHCKTTLIATISPTMSNIEETLSTLEYAFLAKSVTNYPKVNQKINKISSIKEFCEKKSQLQRDLFSTLDKCGINLSEESYCMLKSELNAVRKEFNDKTCEIDKLQQQLKEKELLTASVENELSVNKEEIEKSKKNLEEVNVKLKKITKEHNLLKKNLKKTLPECEDAKLFALWQKENEDKHLEQTEQLLHLVTDSTSDVSLLHRKLERKTKIENVNKMHLQDMKLYCTDKLNKFLKNIEGIYCNQQSLYNDLETNLDSFVNLHKKKSNEIAEKVTILQKSYAEYVPNLLHNLKIEGSTHDKLCEEQITAINQDQSLFQNVLLEAEKNSDILNEIQQQIIQKGNVFNNMKKMLHKHFNGMKLTFNNITDQQQILHKMIDCNNDYEDNKKNKLNISSQLECDMKNATKALTDKWDVKYQEIQQWETEFKKLLMEHKLAINNIPKHSQNLMNIKESIATNKIAVISETDKLKCAAENMRKELSSYIISSKSNEEDEVQKFNSISKSVIHQNDLLRESIKNFPKIVEVDLNLDLENRKTLVDNYAEQTSFNSKTVQTELNNVFGITHKVENDYGEILVHNQEEQRVYNIQQKDILFDITNRNHAQFEETKEVIKKFADDTEKYLNNFKNYEPTGETPVRKEYSYPRTVTLSNSD